MPKQLTLDECWPPPPAVGHHHPNTSVQAAQSVRISAGSGRRLVFDYVVECGWYGATDEEIQTNTGLEGSTERPRRGELVTGGYLMDSGKRRKTHSGHNAIVWKHTGKALPDTNTEKEK